MWRLDLRRDENYSEYLRLLQNDDYYDVTYDEVSGGVSAVHRFHKFDKQLGIMGYPRGEYEKNAIASLRKKGHRIILESEIGQQGEKRFDGFLDDWQMDIKAIEGNGIWSISTKIHDAIKQGANCVVFVFPDRRLYSFHRITDGLGKFITTPGNVETQMLSRVIAIVEDQVACVWNKKATPIEGWSVSEGFWRQNGAAPFTISPSDAKV